MKAPAPPRSLRDLRHLTPARIGLGRVGGGLPTSALLEFTLDHARARDAVHASFDSTAIASGLRATGLETLEATSLAQRREDYLKRPDLGRRLSPASQTLLACSRRGRCDLAIVIGDGLSPSAVNAHAVELVRCLIPKLAAGRVEVGPVVLATGARVALGDEIGALLDARMVAMLIGERPGLSVPASLGAYVTFGPGAACTDAMRNCVSNIHSSGLGHDAAAIKIAWLVREGLARQETGVMLKDESGGRVVARVTSGARPA